jgi:copper chaperone CopZ
VRSALSAVPGVQKVDINYSKKTATVYVAKDAPVDTKAMVASLEKAGYGGAVRN